MRVEHELGSGNSRASEKDHFSTRQLVEKRLDRQAMKHGLGYVVSLDSLGAVP